MCKTYSPTSPVKLLFGTSSVPPALPGLSYRRCNVIMAAQQDIHMATYIHQHPIIGKLAKINPRHCKIIHIFLHLATPFNCAYVSSMSRELGSSFFTPSCSIEVSRVNSLGSAKFLSLYNLSLPKGQCGAFCHQMQPFAIRSRYWPSGTLYVMDQ